MHIYIYIYVYICIRICTYMYICIYVNDTRLPKLKLSRQVGIEPMTFSKP